MKNSKGPASINMWPAIITGVAAVIASVVLLGCAKDDGTVSDTDAGKDAVTAAVSSETAELKTDETDQSTGQEDAEAQAVESVSEEEPAEAAAEISFEQVDPSKVAFESPILKEESSLPAYEYPGPELFYSVVYDYIVKEFGSRYLSGEVTIPCPIIVAEEDNSSEVLLYGNFQVYNYTLGTDGKTLMTISGGSHPGLMHIAKTEAGYEVTGFDPVLDGSEYTPSARRIFGSYYDSFVEATSDDKAAEETRAQIIANYAAANDLDITGYQDYGWEKRALPTENIDSFYSELN